MHLYIGSIMGMDSFVFNLYFNICENCVYFILKVKKTRRIFYIRIRVHLRREIVNF